jgi:hypothetical protein
MVPVFYDSNKGLIDTLQKKGAEFICFHPEKCGANYSTDDVSRFVSSIEDSGPHLYFINLEPSWEGILRTELSGLYFYQCLLKEYGSSKNFNYIFYSFQSLPNLLKLNNAAIIIRPQMHRQLPFDILHFLTDYA